MMTMIGLFAPVLLMLFGMIYLMYRLYPGIKAEESRFSRKVKINAFVLYLIILTLAGLSTVGRLPFLLEMDGSALLVILSIFLVTGFGFWFCIRIVLFMMVNMMIQGIDDLFGDASEKGKS